MRSDFDIKRDVEDELRSDPDIRNRYRHRGERWCRDTDRVRSQLSPEARGGARCQACRWRVGMANNIEVRLPIVHRRPDPEIARDAVEEIQRDLPSSWEKIRVIVEDGWLTLEGEVEWHYQCERAKKAGWRVPGVKGVINNIQVRPQVPPVEIKRKDLFAAIRKSSRLKLMQSAWRASLLSPKTSKSACLTSTTGRTRRSPEMLSRGLRASCKRSGLSRRMAGLRSKASGITSESVRKRRFVGYAELRGLTNSIEVKPRVAPTDQA